MNCGHSQSQPTTHSPRTGQTLRLGTPGPALHPRGSRPSLTLNLLRCKLDLKGDPRDCECQAQRVEPAHSMATAQASTSWLPQPVPLPAAQLLPHNLLPSTLAPSCLLALPDLCTPRAVGPCVPRP